MDATRPPAIPTNANLLANILSWKIQLKINKDLCEVWQSLMQLYIKSLFENYLHLIHFTGWKGSIQSYVKVPSNSRTKLSYVFTGFNFLFSTFLTICTCTLDCVIRKFFQAIRSLSVWWSLRFSSRWLVCFDSSIKQSRICWRKDRVKLVKPTDSACKFNVQDMW